MTILSHTGASNPADSVKAAAKQVQSFLSSGANSSAPQQNSTGFALPAAHKNSTSEAKAIGNLVAGSVQLGADLAESGHAVSLAAAERVSALHFLDSSSCACAPLRLPKGETQQAQLGPTLRISCLFIQVCVVRPLYVACRTLRVRLEQCHGVVEAVYRGVHDHLMSL